MRGAVVAPELAKLERERERLRNHTEERLLTFLEKMREASCGPKPLTTAKHLLDAHRRRCMSTAGA